LRHVEVVFAAPLAGRFLCGISMALALLAAGCGEDGPPTEGSKSSATLAVLQKARWPMFHGEPALAGLADGTLPDRLELVWRFKTRGAVKSSPVVGDGRVFVGSDDGCVYAIDFVRGAKVWAYETKGGVEAAPLLLDGTVYVGSTDGFLYALDAATGRLKWKYETGSQILGAANWTRPAGRRRRLDVASSDGFWILVGSYDSRLHCVDSRTGAKVWTCETASYINGAPAVADGAAVFGGCDAVLHVVSLADGKVLKAIDAGAYVAASPALADGRAYVGNYEGRFLCADVNTGEVLWTFEKENAAFYSSPAVSGSAVVVGARDRRLHCFERATGAERWALRMRGDVDSSPAVCGDKVVVGSNGGWVVVVRMSDGAAVWSFEIGEAVSSSPAVAGGRIVIGSEDGAVYAFGTKP